MNPSARHSASAICRPTARGVSETRPFVFLKIHTVSEKNTTTVCAFQSSVIIRLTEKRLNNRRRRTTYTDADRNTRKIIDIQGGDAKKKTPPFFPLSDGGRKRCIYIERNLCRCCVIAAWSSSRNGSETGLKRAWSRSRDSIIPHNRQRIRTIDFQTDERTEKQRCRKTWQLAKVSFEQYSAVVLHTVVRYGG